MRITTILFAIVFLVINLFFPSPNVLSRSAAASGDQKGETRRGWFTTLWGDPLETETGAETVTKFFLTDETGTIELVIDPQVLQAAGGVSALDRKMVSVTGQPAIDRISSEQVFSAADIKPEKSDSPVDAGQNASAPAASRPFVNILCRYSDSVATTPKDANFFTGFFNNTRPGLDHYFRDISFNNIDLAGTYTVGWFNLPQPRSYYFTADPPNFQRMAADCTAAANAVVDFSTVQGINMFFNQNTGCCAWGGSQTMTLDGVTRSFPITYMPPGGIFQSILAHEMGHSFGWAHSANALGTTYQSGWDVMSNDRFNQAAATDALYGSVGQNTIAYNLDKVGWIPANRKFTAGIGSTTIDLEKLSLPGAGNYLMAQIPINGTTDFYTVEARFRNSYDAKLPNDAVVIHRVIPSRTDDAWTVDEDGNANPMDAGGQWLPGETFSDAANRITVKINSATPTSFNVTITKLAAPTAAGVSISGRVRTASGRGIRNVQITLIDSNGNTKSAQTTAFGYYRFDDVAAGETVTLTAKARQFRFDQSTIVRTANESISNADFVSEK